VNLFSESLKQTFVKYKETELFGRLQSTYDELIKRKVLRIDYPDDISLNGVERLRLNCNVYEQILLHRAISLFEASLGTLSDRNVYALALCIRGHYETTAALGYLHKRCMSFLEKTISFADFETDIKVQMLAWKEPSKVAEAPDPVQILTQLDDTDKVMYRKFLKSTGNHKKMLRDSYEFLCNFCHPNFHSNMAAYSYDKKSKAVVLRYGDDLRDNEFFIGRLWISSDVFVWLFDEFQACIGEIKQQ
jgi:hypothetical protein